MVWNFLWKNCTDYAIGAQERSSPQTGGARKGFPEEETAEVDLSRLTESIHGEKEVKAEGLHETQVGNDHAENYLGVHGDGQREKTHKKETTSLSRASSIRIWNLNCILQRQRGDQAAAYFWPPSLGYSPLKDRLTYCSLFVLADFWIKEVTFCFQMEFLSWVSSWHFIGNQW